MESFLHIPTYTWYTSGGPGYILVTLLKMHTIVNPVLKMRLHPTAHPISLLRGSNLRGKPKTASTSSPTTKSSINLHPELRKTKQSPHVRESETVLDSGFHAVDSGFLPVTRFQILVSGTWIPDSLSCIADSEAQDSVFQNQKFPESRFPYMVRK